MEEIMAAKEKKIEKTDGSYDMTKAYAVGDKFFHSKWEETGAVESIGETEDGIKKMMVRFPKAGLKKLVMEFTGKQ
jgi:hypothetical protein